ncbi:MAG: TonB-dependent receptor [Flammeovirgaceae bacterium]|jgi:TonB-linked SusC/RagA family outer membrane protein|nr:TonB-dependent receptor [Flammeovirgaceae bacterium]
MSNKYEALRKLHLLLFILIVLPLSSWAQSKTVTGRVVSKDDNSPLPGVNISEKGTLNGTVTDSDGNFSIKTSDEATLIFSFIGYKTQEVQVGSRTNLDIQLEVDVLALEEIVVVGYGQQEKKDVTGAVAAISTKDFNKGVLTSPQDLLVGRVAGVSVISSGGAPGAGAEIRIRGGSSLTASNDPLIIIDGFPVDSRQIGGSANILASINPNDIESFTVLKDASATAIYGLRASNGVIIITTKKGSAGKPQVQFNSTFSISRIANQVDVMSGDEYRDFVTGLANAGTVSGLNPASLVRLGSANTDWQNEIYRNAVSIDQNISVGGTYKNLPYRISYGFTDQQGILKNTDLQRNSLNINLNPSFFNDHLKVNASLKSAWTKNNFGNQGAVGAAVVFDPTQPIRNGNDIFGGYYTWTELSDNLPGGVMNPNGDPILIASANPVALINQTNNKSDVSRYIGNLQLDYKFHFLPDLRANLNLGFDIQKADGFNNSPANAAFTFREGPGRFQNYSNENRSSILDFYLNYVKRIGENKIDLTGGYSYQEFTREGQTITRIGNGNVIDGIDTDDDGLNDAPRQLIPDPNNLLSFFGRVNYSFKEKYLATVTVRNDYSSRFAEENRSGIFPAVSLGWRIDAENFMDNQSFISDLKLRAGYGVTGQQDIVGNAYPYLPTYLQSTPTAQYEFGGVWYPTLRPGAYDAGIKWEETSTLNLGLDFGFFEGRVNGSLEIYNRETRDLISTIPIPAGSNFSNFLTTNVGNLTNKGIELTLNALAVKTDKLEWNFGMNFTRNRNEITKLLATDDPNYQGIATGGIAGGVGNNIQNHQVGYPANSFFVYQQVYGANGLPLEGVYVDRTGNGGQVSSNENNKYRYRNPAPDYLIGINSRVNYGNFDFSFSSRLSLGNYVYNNVFSSNAVTSQLYNQSGYFSNVPTAVRNTNFFNQQLFSDYYVENASFFKLDNVALGYTLNSLVNGKLKARFSLTVQNALIITDYSGIDPEVAGGIDNNIYPRPTNFLIGVNLTY